MKNRVRRMVALCLAAALAAGAAPAPTPVYASEAEETVTESAETNNYTTDTAIDISSGEKVTGWVERNDTKYYSFTAPKNGYCYFEVSKTTGDNSPVFRVYDRKLVEVSYVVSFHDNQVYRTRAFSVREGDLMYITVENSGALIGRAITKYWLRAVFKEHSYTEDEGNDTASDATTLEEGKAYLGSNRGDYPADSYNPDVDWYKVKATQNGYYTFDLARYDFTTTNTTTWYVTLYDADLNQIYERFSTSSDLSFRYVVKKGKTLYIRVGHYSSSYNGVEALYTIKASFKGVSNIEKEPNAGFGTATTIKIGKTYYATVDDTNGDYNDFYAFKATAAGTYKVAFSFAKSVTSPQYFIVYDASKNQIAESGKISKSGSLKFKAKKGKKYYIQVTDVTAGDGVATGELYKLKVAKVKK